MDFKDLTPEQQEAAKACKSPEELVALAQNVGVQLTDEQMDAIAGGSWYNPCSDHSCENYFHT